MGYQKCDKQQRKSYNYLFNTEKENEEMYTNRTEEVEVDDDFK